jgi:hypothetical protein
MEQIRFAGRRVAGFGVGAWYSTNPMEQVEALVKDSDMRMQQLTDAFNAFSPKWSATNTATYNDFLADYTSLLSRYAIAKILAPAATGFWATPTDIEKATTALTKAFRAGAPGEQTKGDWADLVERLRLAQKATGVPEMVDQPPTALKNVQNEENVADNFYKATAKYDIPAQLTGEMAPHAPVQAALDAAAAAAKAAADAGKTITDAAKWFDDHKTGIAIGATVLVGGILYAIVRR